MAVNQPDPWPKGSSPTCVPTRRPFPELGSLAGSWVCTSPEGKVLEFFERSNAEKTLACGWTVETAMQYLVRVNRGIATRNTAERIGALRGEMGRAPEWKHGTEWWTDRERQLAADERRLAEIAPDHPLLAAPEQEFIHTSVAELAVKYPDLHGQLDSFRSTLDDSVLLRVGADGTVRQYAHGNNPQTVEQWQDLDEPVKAADLDGIYDGPQPAAAPGAESYWPASDSPADVPKAAL